MADSRAMQMRESKQAYAFIQGQVDFYAGQLAAKEGALEAWRGGPPEARMEPTGLIEARIAKLPSIHRARHPEPNSSLSAWAKPKRLVAQAP